MCSNLLTNKKYIDLVKQKRELYKDTNDISKYFDIEKLNFNRIIVDEVHEILVPHEPYGDKYNYLKKEKS